MEDKRQCGCEGCTNTVSSRYDGVWYCNKHYLRLHYCGDLNGRPRKRTTRLKKNGNGTATIITAKGQTILIDEADIEKAMKRSWCISKTGYPVANFNNKVVKMHRYLLDVNDSALVVDHINGNPLDNRRSNLRICDQNSNSKNIGLKKTNTSGCAGVRTTRNNTFSVRITVNRKEIHIGNYKTYDEAVRARRDAELYYYGEYAPNGRNCTSV